MSETPILDSMAAMRRAMMMKSRSPIGKVRVKVATRTMLDIADEIRKHGVMQQMWIRPGGTMEFMGMVIEADDSILEPDH